MSDINQILTQDEIDAMVVKNVSKSAPEHSEIVHAPAPKVAVQKVNVSPKLVIPKVAPAVAPVILKAALGDHEECIAAGEIQSIGLQISNITKRMASIEAQLDKLESKKAAGNETSPNQLKSAIQQIKAVSNQVEIITEGLRGTAGYNVNKTFKCTSCGSSGVVGMKVRCNQCGQENWWGWWPKKK